MSAIAAACRQTVVPLYQALGDKFAHLAKVTWVGHGTFEELKGREYHLVQVDETIFHPKGGGQLADEGTMNGVKVDYVFKWKVEGDDYNTFGVVHCFAQPISFQVGDVVELKIDPKVRYSNSLWHTAAHVVDFLVTREFPQLTGHSGQCYPGSAFMKFSLAPGAKFPTTAEVKAKVEAGYQEMLRTDVHMEMIRDTDGVRKVNIEGHKIPCGGTHVHSLSELGTDLVVRKTEKDKDLFRVSYTINPVIPDDYGTSVSG